MAAGKSRRICPRGHTYFKSSDCPVCPVCAGSELRNDFRDGMSAPARRALETAGITTPEELSKWKKKDLLKLHGLGPASIPGLEVALAASGLGFAGDV